MKYRNLGNTGLEISPLCLGCMTFGTPERGDHPWTLPEQQSRPLIRKAIEMGINFFDTANAYSDGTSEEIVGQALKDYARRDEVVIATKVFFPMSKGPNTSGLSRKRIFHAIDASLKRLGTDYVDLYQIHRWDPHTPVEETMEALHDVVKAGKVRYLGASSMWAWQFAKAQQVARENGWTPFASMQNHYNLAYREEEREMLPLCRDQGIAVIPWSPLARGFLAGNRTPGDIAAGSRPAARSRAETDDIAQKYYYRDSDFATVQRLAAMASAKGVSNATLAYAWLLHKGVTAPIVGASKLPQLDQAAAAVDLALTADEIAQLESGYEPHPVTGHA